MNISSEDRSKKPILKIINNKIDVLREILNKNDDIMSLCYIEILKILRKYPPAKNENKFIYGKLIEKSIINHINKIIPCIELDKLEENSVGSEYKNDCRCLDTDFSIKASKSGGIITIINKRNKQTHSIDNLNFIICHIANKKLYIFSHNTHSPFEKYKEEDGGGIHYKSGIFTYFKKNDEYSYSFKENDIVKDFIANELPLIKESDIYEKLYQEL